MSAIDTVQVSRADLRFILDRVPVRCRDEDCLVCKEIEPVRARLIAALREANK